MAAQDEREPGVVVMCSLVGRPMVQDIPEQDIVMGELELPPQMDPKPEMGAAEAAVYDTSPSLLHKDPSPIPAQTARPSAVDMAQLVAILAGMENRMENNINNKMKNEINGIREGMEANTSRMEQTMREEMQCMGAGLQGGLEELNKGNEELLRATSWGRLAEVTEEVTVTEYAETREMTRIGERLHGVEKEEEGDAHTHTHR